MFNILFVCHGNICRSPMAEFYMRHLLKNEGLESRVCVASAATSSEELGNPTHSDTCRVLAAHGVAVDKGKRAVRFCAADYDRCDLIVIMDENNRRWLPAPKDPANGDKVHKLLEYAGSGRDVADPWYTGDFETTYRDVEAGCEGLLRHIRPLL